MKLHGCQLLLQSFGMNIQHHSDLSAASTCGQIISSFNCCVPCQSLSPFLLFVQSVERYTCASTKVTSSEDTSSSLELCNHQKHTKTPTLTECSFQIANHINLRKRPGGLDHDMTFYFRTIRKLNGISSFWCRRQHYYAICCLAFLFLDVDIFRLISFCQSVFKFDIPNNLNCNYRVFHPLKAQL